MRYYPTDYTPVLNTASKNRKSLCEKVDETCFNWWFWRGLWYNYRDIPYYTLALLATYFIRKSCYTIIQGVVCTLYNVYFWYYIQLFCWKYQYTHSQLRKCHASPRWWTLERLGVLKHVAKCISTQNISLLTNKYLCLQSSVYLHISSYLFVRVQYILSKLTLN